MQAVSLFARFFAQLSKSRVGIDVALFQVAFGNWVQGFFQVLGQYQQGDFRHALDNSGDSIGLVADWLAFECWWRPHPSATGGSCGCADNQSRDRPARRLVQRNTFTNVAGADGRGRTALLAVPVVSAP